MIAATLALSMLAPQGQPPRLRTLLPNGATVLVERMPAEKTISVQLWASARGAEETPETHGLRHLLEHFLVKGQDRRLGARVETAGGFIRARTYRDAMQVEMSVGPRDLPLALASVGELLSPINCSKGEIAVEAKIIEQELALKEPESVMGGAAWLAAYGPSGLDSLGNIEIIRGASPEVLRGLQSRHLSASNLVLVVAGPVELDPATRLASAVLGGLPKVTPTIRQSRAKALPATAEAAAFGEARAAIVPGYREKATAASLAAALAVAGEVGHCFVTYTPTASNGLVIIGRSEFSSGLGDYIDALDGGTAVALFGRGKALAAEWVSGQLRNAQGAASLRGMLLCQGPAHRPELMLESIQSLTPDDFLLGVDSLRKGKAVIAVGGQ